MKTIINFVQQHPLVTFFVLGYALSWGLLAALPDAPLLFPTGPFFAALITSAIAEGRAGVRTLLGRAFRWRTGLRWYAAALGLPAIIVSLAVLLNIWLGAPAPNADQLAGWPMLFVPFIMRFIFIGLGEEPGWRGYALPRLQMGRSALAASLLLGLVWAGWHIPLLIQDRGFNPVVWAPALLSTIFSSVTIAWLFNNTDSAWMTALFHASYSTFGNQFFFHIFSGADSARLDWLDAGMWAVMAVIVVIFAGSERLSRKPAAVAVESALAS
jgi:membrane protease YdiL (CAAX protease family)